MWLLGNQPQPPVALVTVNGGALATDYREHLDSLKGTFGAQGRVNVSTLPLHPPPLPGEILGDEFFFSNPGAGQFPCNPSHTSSSEPLL